MTIAILGLAGVIAAHLLVNFNTTDVGPDSGSTTNPTCSSSASSPVAAVGGVALSGCEDFNDGTSHHFFPYKGGGDDTVTGAGRVPSQCTYGDGALTLTQDTDGATCGGGTSFTQKYGLWEVRMRAYSTGSAGSEPHPALILWPDNDKWRNGELDFFETDIGDPARGNLHCVGANIEKVCYAIPVSAVDYSQYHVFSILWQPGKLEGFIDGKHWWSTADPSVMPSTAMRLTIQLDHTGRPPVRIGKMEVDWIHVYK